MSDSPYVDPAFRHAIGSHVAGNLIVERTASPLLLGIFGPPGEGKTFQTNSVCAELGVAINVVSPGELESESAGHPAQLLRRQYLRASEDIGSGKPSVLLINDIDTAIGDWGSLVQYTMNRQMIFGQLMAFCDYPNEVSGRTCERVPIVFTGNNPSSLYGPLTRPGRMRQFQWAPSASVRASIVATIFPFVAREVISDLVLAYPEQPTSFWADVKAAVIEQQLSEWVATQPPGALREFLRQQRRVTLDPSVVTISELAATAKRLADGLISDKSYLSPREDN